MKSLCVDCEYLKVYSKDFPCIDCGSDKHHWKKAVEEVPETPLVSLEGRKDDSSKLRYDLYPPEALEGTVRILTFGAEKYSDRNWEKGMKWGRVFGALMRHLWAWWRGEAADPETGESHLHHAACCIAFLQTYEARGIGQDDRPSSIEKN